MGLAQAEEILKPLWFSLSSPFSHQPSDSLLALLAKESGFSTRTCFYSKLEAYFFLLSALLKKYF